MALMVLTLHRAVMAVAQAAAVVQVILTSAAAAAAVVAYSQVQVAQVAAARLIQRVLAVAQGTMALTLGLLAAAAAVGEPTVVMVGEKCLEQAVRQLMIVE